LTRIKAARTVDGYRLVDHWSLAAPSLMPTRPKPDWILIANTTRARVLQQEPRSAMVVLESFVHPAGRGQRTELMDARQKECTRFAHELGKYLEHEAHVGHFGSLTIFAPASFLEELRAALGTATLRALAGTHELDLTSIGVSELERRVSQELALAGS
jgi:protein required for attachment to host cells